MHVHLLLLLWTVSWLLPAAWLDCSPQDWIMLFLLVLALSGLYRGSFLCALGPISGSGSLWSLQGQLPMRPGTHVWLRIYRGSFLCALFFTAGNLKQNKIRNLKPRYRLE